MTMERGEDRLFLGKFLGIVRDNQDPLKLGRIRAVVPEVAGPDEVLGWAIPCFPTGFQQDRGSDDVEGLRGWGFFDVPAIGSGVFVEFLHGYPNLPIWVGSWPQTPFTVAINQPDGVESVQPENTPAEAFDSIALDSPFASDYPNTAVWKKEKVEIVGTRRVRIKCEQNEPGLPTAYIDVGVGANDDETGLPARQNIHEVALLHETHADRDIKERALRNIDQEADNRMQSIGYGLTNKQVVNIFSAAATAPSQDVTWGSIQIGRGPETVVNPLGTNPAGAPWTPVGSVAGRRFQRVLDERAAVSYNRHVHPLEDVQLTIPKNVVNSVIWSENPNPKVLVWKPWWATPPVDPDDAGTVYTPSGNVDDAYNNGVMDWVEQMGGVENTTPVTPVYTQGAMGQVGYALNWLLEHFSSCFPSEWSDPVTGWDPGSDLNYPEFRYDDFSTSFFADYGAETLYTTVPDFSAMMDIAPESPAWAASVYPQFADWIASPFQHPDPGSENDDGVGYVDGDGNIAITSSGLTTGPPSPPERWCHEAAPKFGGDLDGVADSPIVNGQNFPGADIQSRAVTTEWLRAN